MTAEELDALSALYDAHGFIVRELGVAIDRLRDMGNAPLEDVVRLHAEALARVERAYACSASCRERYA